MWRILPWLVATAIVAAWLAWPEPESDTPAPSWLADADPARRAAACRHAGVARLIARAGDTDWRVRAAAFAALDRIAQLDVLPMRDTPMAQRERVLLRWIEQNVPDLQADLCELYADPAYIEFGQTLVERCLTCHAGPQPAPELSPAQCVACHERAHAEWKASAHARSLSHLQLPTVDPDTRRSALYDFGTRTGMSCVACHEPAGEHAACLATFRTVACASCHAEADAQWRQWLVGEQPRRVVWPPGTITFARATDTRGCIDCHMPDGEHRWDARRSLEMLRSGVAMTVRQNDAGDAEIVLTNLAGHDYPTGTRRRALRLYASINDEPERLIATLCPSRLDDASVPGSSAAATSGRPDTPQPALRPGEQRTFTLPGRPKQMRCRLVYIRDRFVSDSYTAEIATVDRALSPR